MSTGRFVDSVAHDSEFEESREVDGPYIGLGIVADVGVVAKGLGKVNEFDAFISAGQIVVDVVYRKDFITVLLSSLKVDPPEAE